jgi:bifunctional oligoribonuclease and PAP phosphatase NrnA
MNDFSLLKDLLEKHNSFLLTTHVNPDADALGSQLAFYLILKKLGKKVRAINHSATPYNLVFLDNENVIEKFDENLHRSVFNETNVVIILDANQGNRVVRMEKSLKEFNGIKICIDHHQEPENIFNFVFGSPDYSATSEIIYDFIENTGVVELDYKMAYQLYAGIMTDTGSFRFERTTPRLHNIIATLLAKGVDPVEVYDKIYNQFEFGRVKLLGEALNSIQIDSSKKIAYMMLKREDLIKTGTSEADIDGIVNYCLTIKDVEIGILFYELKDGIKISFRSKGTIPVNKLASKFGGGGHINASGTRLFKTTIEQVMDEVISSAQAILNN